MRLHGATAPCQDEGGGLVGGPAVVQDLCAHRFAHVRQDEGQKGARVHHAGPRAARAARAAQVLPGLLHQLRAHLPQLPACLQLLRRIQRCDHICICACNARQKDKMFTCLKDLLGRRLAIHLMPCSSSGTKKKRAK